MKAQSLLRLVMQELSDMHLCFKMLATCGRSVAWYQLSCARCLSHCVRCEQPLVILVEEKVTIALTGTCVSAPLGHVGCALCVSAVLQLLAF